MNKPAVVFLIACCIAAGGVNKAPASAKPTGGQEAPSAPSGESIRPQSFEGTWQGVWHGYGTVNHHESGSQSSLTVTITVKAAGTSKLSGITATSTWQHQPIQIPRPSLGTPPPPPAPPPPPLPTPPPSGKMLNPRTEGRAFIFQVKDPDAKLVGFRLSLQGSGAGTLRVTTATHSRVYPEFQMKRVG